MRHLLHISDVHFGPPHLREVSDAVVEMANDRRPDLVVVSGDLTQRAKPAQFREARRFVDRFESPTLTVPGNHDVPMYRVWERVFAPYHAYRKHFAREMEPTFEDEELFVVGINTAHGWTIDNGRITRRRLAEVGRLLERAPAAKAKVVVAHHHLIPPPRFNSQEVLRNAERAVDLFSRLGVDIILSGHQHQSYIGNSEEFYHRGRLPVVILHSGTTTSNRGRGGEKDRNSCNWVEITGEAITVSHLFWEASMGRFSEHSRHWYPRQERHPYTLEGLDAAAVSPLGR